MSLYIYITVQPRGTWKPTHAVSEASCIMQDPIYFPFLKEDVHLETKKEKKKKKKKQLFLGEFGFFAPQP